MRINRALRGPVLLGNQSDWRLLNLCAEVAYLPHTFVKYPQFVALIMPFYCAICYQGYEYTFR